MGTVKHSVNPELTVVQETRAFVSTDVHRLIKRSYNGISMTDTLPMGGSISPRSAVGWWIDVSNIDLVATLTISTVDATPMNDVPGSSTTVDPGTTIRIYFSSSSGFYTSQTFPVPAPIEV